MKKILILLFITFNVQLLSLDFLVIDVRTPDEYSLGYVESSKNIEWQEISSIKETINKEQKIYLYCRSGNRSQRATNILIELGYKDVTNLGSMSEAANFLKLKIIN